MQICAVVMRAVRAMRWRFSLYFDLIFEKILFLSTFKFNQQQCAAEIFRHGDEGAFPR